MIDKMLVQMERDVAYARRVYMRAADRRRWHPATARKMWLIYARLLQAYRKEVRKHGRA
jgi:hypothetical protein